MVPGNGKNRLAIQFCIVESVEQVNAAGSGSCQTDTEAAGVLGKATGHKCSVFFMANLNKANLLLSLAQRFHDSVDAISWQSEDDIDSPVDQGFNQNICCSLRHDAIPF